MYMSCRATEELRKLRKEATNDRKELWTEKRKVVGPEKLCAELDTRYHGMLKSGRDMEAASGEPEI
jgi:hypothetical protein